jgi:hypothetical protein
MSSRASRRRRSRTRPDERPHQASPRSRGPALSSHAWRSLPASNVTVVLATPTRSTKGRDGRAAPTCARRHAAERDPVRTSATGTIRTFVCTASRTASSSMGGGRDDEPSMSFEGVAFSPLHEARTDPSARSAASRPGEAATSRRTLSCSSRSGGHRCSSNRLGTSSSRCSCRMPRPSPR